MGFPFLRRHAVSVQSSCGGPRRPDINMLPFLIVILRATVYPDVLNNRCVVTMKRSRWRRYNTDVCVHAGVRGARGGGVMVQERGTEVFTDTVVSFWDVQVQAILFRVFFFFFFFFFSYKRNFGEIPLRRQGQHSKRLLTNSYSLIKSVKIKIKNKGTCTAVNSSPFFSEPRIVFRFSFVRRVIFQSWFWSAGDSCAVGFPARFLPHSFPSAFLAYKKKMASHRSTGRLP